MREIMRQLLTHYEFYELLLSVAAAAGMVFIMTVIILARAVRKGVNKATFRYLSTMSHHLHQQQARDMESYLARFKRGEPFFQ